MAATAAAATTDSDTASQGISDDIDQGDVDSVSSGASNRSGASRGESSTPRSAWRGRSTGHHSFGNSQGDGRITVSTASQKRSPTYARAVTSLRGRFEDASGRGDGGRVACEEVDSDREILVTFDPDSPERDVVYRSAKEHSRGQAAHLLFVIAFTPLVGMQRSLNRARSARPRPPAA